VILTFACLDIFLSCPIELLAMCRCTDVSLAIAWLLLLSWYTLRTFCHVQSLTIGWVTLRLLWFCLQFSLLRRFGIWRRISEVSLFVPSVPALPVWSVLSELSFLWSFQLASVLSCRTAVACCQPCLGERSICRCYLFEPVSQCSRDNLLAL